MPSEWLAFLMMFSELQAHIKLLYFNQSCEKVSTKRRFYYKQGKICLETISNFDLVTNKNKIKKTGFYCIPTEKLSAIKNLIVLLVEKLLYTTARELGKACGKLISMKFGLGDTDSAIKNYI